MESKVLETKPELDGKDWQLLEALQRDARLGYAELTCAMWNAAVAMSHE